MANKILIVEDDIQSREGLARILADHGFDVRSAADVEAAGQILRDFEPDTVLLDIGLPLLSGETFATHLSGRLPNTRIVFMSGKYDMVDPERFGERTLFLNKPLNIEQLLNVLHEDISNTITPVA